MIFKTLLSIFIILIAINSANAQDIAVINIDKIVQESKVMVHIQKEIAKKQELYQEEITNKQNNLEEKQKKLEAKKTLLSQSSLEDEARKFQQEVLNLKEYVDKRQANLQKSSLQAMELVNVKIKEIVEEISQTKDIKLIIPASQTLYFEDSLDISDEILKKLNKVLTKVEVKFDKI